MANVPETPSFDAGIYQIETTDPVLGGVNGIANVQAKGLANRTAFLKQQIDQLNSGQFAPSWIASQSYVQGELQKLDAKQSVRAATVANITLSGVQTIDGVALAVGDRVLVKDQTTAAQNGIYLVAAQGWARSSDADNGTKLSSGARIAVEEGDFNAGRVWYLEKSGPVSIGTTPLVFIDEHAQASESSPGVARIATQQQVDAGSDDTVMATPKKLTKHYRQGNILGAVSQLLGVPTGAIIESGSNANGEYVKFASGLMICMLRVDVNHNVSIPNSWGSTAGSGFVPADSIWTFPASFAPGSIPMGWGSPEGRYSHGGAASHLSQINNVGAQKRSWMNSAANIVVNYVAIGKWF
ncbi:hypothetical protein RF663_04445 [Aeromonas veronii]|uniref:hypothetical protein n=1 Tax=Aeromonas veronii TaxID=654 RepID=UPI002853359E|nr:hypothetical protein [Aeromonas veronii]MDR5013498.1 hypothetical protein [Aeromonas veronii]